MRPATTRSSPGLAWPRPTLQWHSDTFELPEGATLLATSPAYPHQAFRVGERAYGVQFHLEVTDEMADEWARVPEYVVAAERALGAGGLERARLRTSCGDRADADADRAPTLGRLLSRWAEPSARRWTAA